MGGRGAGGQAGGGLPSMSRISLRLMPWQAPTSTGMSALEDIRVRKIKKGTCTSKKAKTGIYTSKKS